MNAEVLENAVNTAGEVSPETGSAPVITEENLFDLVENGEITLEEANEFLDGQEDASLSDDSALDSGADNRNLSAATNEAGNVGEGEPYRVFNTQEDFQRAFDNAWNKRYGKMMHDSDAKAQEYQALLSDLGTLLGVDPSEAAQELKNRRRRLEAERRGVDPEDYSARMQAEEDRDFYKNQLEAQQKQAEARAVVENIRAQGARIRAHDQNFDIENAMNNPEFAKMVFSLTPTMPERAVEIAYREFYGGNRASVPVQGQLSAPPVQRPLEGGMVGGVNAQRKPIDFSKMSDAEIERIQDQVIGGKRFDL